jgi:hypothetical protein
MFPRWRHPITGHAAQVRCLPPHLRSATQVDNFR